ncbi:hypothetical protein R1flu_006806 [Riccia fluitans]|uniref:Uncharacterized protein n=1 Tax=Riccia fluitans TaxID=41844 RepID=A0ABD1YX18_9MARC
MLTSSRESGTGKDKHPCLSVYGIWAEVMAESGEQAIAQGTDTWDRAGGQGLSMEGFNTSGKYFHMKVKGSQLWFTAVQLPRLPHCGVAG